MLTRDEVVWAFRYILGRDPETEDVLESHRQIKTWVELRSALFKSPEFLSKSGSGELPDVWVLAEVMGGSRLMWVNLADRHVSLGCLTDNYEPFESRVFTRLVQPGDTVLDIGANIGWYSMIASTLVGPDGKIFAFEPRPTTSTRLKASIEVNGLGRIAEVKEVAVGEAPGEAVLTWVKGTENPGGSHLTRNPIGAESVGVAVPVITLDSMQLDRCDVIKIDVEGAEARVMQGAKSLLSQFKPVILSELHPTQLRYVSRTSARDYIGFLIEMGYVCYLIDPTRPIAQIVDFPAELNREVTNVMFVPAGKDGILDTLNLDKS